MHIFQRDGEFLISCSQPNEEKNIFNFSDRLLSLLICAYSNKIIPFYLDVLNVIFCLD